MRVLPQARAVSPDVLASSRRAAMCCRDTSAHHGSLPFRAGPWNTSWIRSTCSATLFQAPGCAIYQFKASSPACRTGTEPSPKQPLAPDRGWVWRAKGTPFLRRSRNASPAPGGSPAGNDTSESAVSQVPSRCEDAPRERQRYRMRQRRTDPKRVSAITLRRGLEALTILMTPRSGHPESPWAAARRLSRHSP